MSPPKSCESPANNRHCADIRCFPEQTLWNLDIKIETFVSLGCHHKVTGAQDRHVYNVSVRGRAGWILPLVNHSAEAVPLCGCTAEGSTPLFNFAGLWEGSWSCFLAAEGWEHSKMSQIESPDFSAGKGLQGHSAIHCIILEPLQDKCTPPLGELCAPGLLARPPRSWGAHGSGSQLPAQTARLCSTVGGMSMEKEWEGERCLCGNNEWIFSSFFPGGCSFFFLPALFFFFPFFKEEDLNEKKNPLDFFFFSPLPPLPLPLMWPLV